MQSMMGHSGESWKHWNVTGMHTVDGSQEEMRICQESDCGHLCYVLTKQKLIF